MLGVTVANVPTVCVYRVLTPSRRFGGCDPTRYLLAVVWAAGEVFTTGSYIEATTVYENVYQFVAQSICGVAYAYLLGAFELNVGLCMCTRSVVDAKLCDVVIAFSFSSPYLATFRWTAA